MSFFVYDWLKARWRARVLRPPLGRVRFGDFRRISPFSRSFGFDRGQPVDRYYIEAFLDRHADDIHGRVLEIGDSTYTRQFGGSRVEKSDVLHIKTGNPQATIVGDLSSADHIPESSFDCIILTQTLHLIYDVPAAIQTLYRILSPRGILLATVPGISQTDGDEWAETWYWAFTELSTRRLFEENFSTNNLEVAKYGNVLTATAFLYGLSSGELTRQELNDCDPLYQLLITVRARKPEDRG